MPRLSSRPAPRDPLPDPVELLRAAVDGLGQPLIALERLFDRMEGAQ